MLILLTIVFRDRPRALVVLFTLELATYALFLFEPNEGRLYVERGFLIALLSAKTEVTVGETGQAHT
jgi:hypothetical protein